MATVQGISLPATADRSVMPIECTAISACWEGSRRKYHRRADPTQMGSGIQFRSVVSTRRAMEVPSSRDYQNVATQLVPRPGAAAFVRFGNRPERPVLRIIWKHDAGELLDPRRQVALVVMLTGIFVTIMDTSIVNVAIPSIRSTLGASFAEAELVVAGYAFTFAVGLITGGRLGDIFGQRRMFLIDFGAFTLASALCGLAPWPTVLVISRLLQGISAAILSPQVFALLRVTFTEGRAFNGVRGNGRRHRVGLRRRLARIIQRI
jgi:hypothetical protein